MHACESHIYEDLLLPRPIMRLAHQEGQLSRLSSFCQMRIAEYILNVNQSPIVRLQIVSRVDISSLISIRIPVKARASSVPTIMWSAPPGLDQSNMLDTACTAQLPSFVLPRKYRPQ